MARPEVTRINTSGMKEYSGVPHIERTFLHPPGLTSPESWRKWGLYAQNDLDRVIKESNALTDGGKILLNGLLQDGGVGMFGNAESYDLGINYDLLLKSDYDHKKVDPAMQELAWQMKDEATAMGIKIDGVLAPEISGLKPAMAFSGFLEDASCINIKKNGSSPQSVGVAVDSYTSDKTDILSIAESVLQKQFREGKTNFVLADDIIDSGIMTQAVALILQLARDRGYDINLVGIVTPIEKVYTQARKTINANLGPIPIKSILQIEDIGILDEANQTAWIKIVGMDKAIQCNLTDSRAK